jgi:hypothetical protein
VNARPSYRPAQDAYPSEQQVVQYEPAGTRTELTLRQVGWIGGTGAFYELTEDPRPTEPASFAPLWMVAAGERLADTGEIEMAGRKCIHLGASV